MAAAALQQGSMPSREINEVKDHLIDMINTANAERSALKNSPQQLADKLRAMTEKAEEKQRRRNKADVTADGKTDNDRRPESGNAETNVKSDNETQRKDVQLQSQKGYSGAVDWRMTGQGASLQTRKYDDPQESNSGDLRDDVVGTRTKLGRQRTGKSDKPSSNDGSSTDSEEVFKNKTRKRKRKTKLCSTESSNEEDVPRGEIKVASDFTVHDAKQLMLSTRAHEITRDVIQHEIKSNTAYVYDMEGQIHMWLLDDRVLPGEPVRDWCMTKGEARPRTADPKDQLYIRKYVLRDKGKQVDFWRDVYTTVDQRNIKKINFNSTTNSKVVVRFYGENNYCDVLRIKKEHDESEETDKVVKGMMYEKKTEELAYNVNKGLQHGTSGSALYGELVLEAAVVGKTLRPARNVKQVYNSKQSSKRIQHQYDDDMVDLAHMARIQGGKIIRQYNVYPMLLITRHKGIQEHFNHVMEAGAGVVAHYDTTFNLGSGLTSNMDKFPGDTYIYVVFTGNRFMSAFSVKHPWLLTKKNQQPAVPAAVLYHEGQKAKSTHEPFFDAIVEDMAGFNHAKNVLITDREASIRKAVRNKLPNVQHVFCHNHMRRNVKQWTGTHFPAKDARRYRKDFKQLLFASDETELNALLNKFCPGDCRVQNNPNAGTNDDDVDKTVSLSDSETDLVNEEMTWDDKMKDYYFNYQDKDLRSSYRGAFRSLGIFNKHSGITNNAAENINVVFKTTVMKNNNNPTQYECVMNMYKWQNRLYFDIGRGLGPTGGELHVNKHFHTEAATVPKVQLEDHEVMFDEKDMKIIDHEKIINLEEYCNYNAKRTRALELLKKNLVHPVVTNVGFEDVYVIKTGTNTMELVTAHGRTCTCKNARCEHKIAVAMLTGDLHDNNPVLKKGAKEGTLTGVYTSTKIKGVGKKWGQERNPQIFDKEVASQNSNGNNTDDDVSNSVGEGTDFVAATANTVAGQEHGEGLILPEMNEVNYKTQLFRFGGLSDMYFSDLKSIPATINKSEIQGKDLENFMPGWFTDNVMFAYLFEISDKERTLVINPIKISVILQGKQGSEIRDYVQDEIHMPSREKVSQLFLGSLRDVTLLRTCRLVCKSWNIEACQSLGACSKVFLDENSSSFNNFTTLILKKALGPLQHFPSPFQHFHVRGSTFTNQTFTKFILNIPITSLALNLEAVGKDGLGVCQGQLSNFFVSNKTNITDLEITAWKGAFQLQKFEVNDATELTCLKRLQFYDFCKYSCSHIQFMQNILSRCKLESLHLDIRNTESEFLNGLLPQVQAKNLTELKLHFWVSSLSWNNYLCNLQFLRLRHLIFWGGRSVQNPEDLQQLCSFFQNTSPLLEYLSTDLSICLSPELSFPSLRSIYIHGNIILSYFTPDRFPSLAKVSIMFTAPLNVTIESEVPHSDISSIDLSIDNWNGENDTLAEDLLLLLTCMSRQFPQVTSLNFVISDFYRNTLPDICESFPKLAKLRLNGKCNFSCFSGMKESIMRELFGTRNAHRQSSSTKIHCGLQLETIKLGMQFTLDPLMIRHCLSKVSKLRQLSFYWNKDLTAPLLQESLGHLQRIVICNHARQEFQDAMAQVAETLPNAFFQ
ncbi:unnamed protein product [Allacma fusca]|uniref:SWIM-type domain-containing protein n=1 Tax=Allacma fusca TaxID=39272 RepID=A0A8J2KPA0_9HEXA|nr:unnamed protein product [Allacma fusca]